MKTQRAGVKTQRAADQTLLDAFVDAFLRGETDMYGRPSPPPVHYATDAGELEPIYALIPGKFPPLYEQMVLSCRWPLVELPYFSLLPNPPGPTLGGLLAEMQRDKILWNTLLPNSYVPFGRAWGGHYDPICFDLRHRQKDGDCPLVMVEHESILCYDRIGETSVIAASFRDVVQAVVKNGANPRYYKATCP